MQDFRTKEQVVNYLERVKSSYSTTNSDYLESERIFNTRIETLKDLKEILYKEECVFLKKILGNNNFTPKEALEEIQKKIDTWNRSGAQNLFNDKITEIILDIMNNFYGISLDQLQEAYINNILITDLVPDLILDLENPGNMTEQLYEGINNNLKQKGKTTFNKATFLSKITLVKKEDNYSIQFDENISSQYRRRFTEIYNSTINDEEKQIKGKGMLKERILEALKNGGISGEPLNWISVEINDNLQKYAISYNFAVIKGFLGEVYWAAFFNFLSGTKGAVKPTGNIKNLKGQSISIDLLLENFGFQVKNYRIKNGQVNLGLKNNDVRLVGTFILDRAEVSPSEALLLFFGAWGYNRPIENASQEYRDLYNSMPEQFDVVNKIFQLHVDKIIGIDKEFQQKINEEEMFFPEEKVYYNSFFLINDKIVPSSEIIQSIIEGFEESATKVKFKGEYSLRDVGDDKLWPQGNPSSLLHAANLVTINYQVLINVKDILEKAYNNMK